LLGTQNQNLVFNLSVTHSAPQTTSRVIIKSVLGDKANVTINSRAIIKPGAKGSKTWLETRVLLFDKAGAEATPSLEILNNDISAGHATTVSPPDMRQLFYLMSRGLASKSAEQLVVQGFVQDVITAFPPELAKKAKQELKL
jgi:Fe-S cluster assembly protein SufD